MALAIANRVLETSATTGTGTYSLAGAVSGYQTFVAGIGTGNTCYYAATMGAGWEVGVGTVTDATPDTLARTTIIASSNANAAVDWAAGTKSVFVTVPASKAVYADASGNVGIGTTAPGESLDVAAVALIGSSNAKMLRLYSTADEAIIRSRLVASDATSQLAFNGTPIRFLIASAEKVRIDTSGNVGIGTTAPQSLLDIQGPVGTAAACAGILTLATKELTIVDGDELGRINFNSPLATPGSDAILAGAAIWAEADDTFSASVNSTELCFGTATTSAAVERMRIDSAGNVGIGTATPAMKLQVVGKIGAYASESATPLVNGLEFYDGYTGLRQAPTTHSFNIDVYNSNVPIAAVTILQSGNVGIGTTNPTRTLDVESALNPIIRVAQTTTPTTGTTIASINFGANIAAEYLVGGAIRAVAESEWSSTRAGGLAFDTIKASATVPNVMYLNQSGNVGIGTTAPAEKLQTADAIAISNTTEGNTARMTRRTVQQVVTLTGATSVTTVNIPAGALLLGASFCVNTAVSDDTADPDTWSAAFSGGSTATLATAAAAAKQTKVNTMIVPAVASATTNITFTPQGGSFDAGVIEVVAYYEVLTSLADAA